jgi:hypothetical protein
MAAQAIVEEWRFIRKVTDEDNINQFMYKVVNAEGVIGRFLLHFDTTQNYQITDIYFYVHSESKTWFTKKVTQISSPPTLVLDLFLDEGNFVERKKIQITNKADKPGFDDFIIDLMQCERDFISADRENRGPGGAGGAGGVGGAGGAGGGAGEEKTAGMLQHTLRF